ncbi:hypothetical protein [Frigoriflavimonas asaccharolytica]|uniref:Uncharacterized protein n=1 Tax=Frigoriflavimonas asaccharolytica TaxID=2735899 RepID=A0A8J8G4Z8_9FLAO|nr:hypothetical protein [Frigoriflavimonas asaccharolytica]NRS91359.1 hypothetical protein [Frigoriflavimonas asaccharolytica]
MKKLSFLFLFFLFTIAHAQCNITGKSSIENQAEETYSIANEIAQCKDCHLWVGVGSNATIVGDNRQNSVKIKANSAGRQIISLAVLTSQGLMQCSKNIDITDGKTSIKNSKITTKEPEPTVDCNVKISDFKEVKYSENIVSFFPIGEDLQFKYIWTATYFDGREVVSKEKIPQFPFTKTDGIRTVKLQMISDNCLKSLSRSYENNYWQYF